MKPADDTQGGLPRRPRAASHVELRTVGDEVLLYNTRNDALLVLRPPAAGVVPLCDGTRTLAEIQSTVAQRLVLSEADAHYGVMLVLGRLQAHSLLSAEE